MNKLIFKTLFKKEFFSILDSYSFWIAFLFFYLSLSLAFLAIPVWFDIGLSDFSYFFSLFPFVYIILIPMLVIDVWPDEYKRQTYKLLFSFPLSASEIVLAKFLATSLCFFMQLSLSAIIPLSLSKIAYIYLPSFCFSYLACFAFGLLCISISLALSSITSESAVAFVFSFLTIAFFSLVDLLPRLIAMPKFLENISYLISFNKHFKNASLGIFDFGDYIFYIALIIFGLALNTFILKQRRAKQ